MLNNSGNTKLAESITKSEIALFESIPGNNVLVLNNPPHFTILGVTESYLNETGKTRHQLVGSGIFEAFPANPDDETDTGERALRHSFQEVIRQKKAHHLPTQRYDVANADGSFDERYLNASNTPVLSTDGEVRLIIHSAVEITHELKVQRREANIKLLEQAHNLFMQAPLAIAILIGENLVIEMANDPIMDVWGKGRDILGKPIREVLPEIESQGFIDLMRAVITTEKPFKAYEMPVSLFRNGDMEEIYFNFVYQPYYLNDKEKPVGIIVFAHEVTAQVQSGKKVKHGEQRLRSLVESAPFPIGVYVGREMRIELANKSIIDIYGKGPDVIGKRYNEILPELDNQEIFKQLDDVFTTGKPFHAKNQRVDIEHDGHLQTYYFNYSFTPLFDESGAVYGVMNTGGDVTDLALAKQEVDRSRENLRNMILQAPVAMCILKGQDYVVEIANDRMIEIWGKHADQLIGKPIFQGLPEAKEQGLEPLLDNVLLTGETFKAFEMPVKLPRKGRVETTYLNFVYEPFYEAGGKITGIIGVAIEVTEQVLARKKIEESEHRFRILGDALPQMVWMRDLQGNIEYGSKHWEAYSGIEGITEAWKAMVHPDEWNQIMESWEKHSRAGEAFDFEVRLKNREGEYRWHHAIAEPLKSREGEILKWIGAVNDIHIQKTFTEKLENLVAERTAALERSNEDLQQFAHVASHDLKEPVRKVMTFSSRLKAELGNELSANATRYLAKIESSAIRMYSMIDGVLLYSTMNAVEQTKELIDMDDLLQSITSDLEVPISKLGASVQFDDLPEVEGSPILIYQLFYNLISNSLKFAKENVPPLITISHAKADQRDLQRGGIKQGSSYIKFSLQDNGIGFADHEADKIFGSFTRLHAKDKYEGTGLGLSLCKKIAERHGGAIYAEGREGIGATFSILLPGN